MSGHIKGKLVVQYDWICASEDDRNVANCGVGGRDSKETEANARRFVACWNACEGTETTALERGLELHPQPVLNLAQINQSLMEQRQEMVEMMRAIPKWIEGEWADNIRKMTAKYSEGRIYLKDPETTQKGRAKEAKP